MVVVGVWFRLDAKKREEKKRKKKNRKIEPYIFTGFSLRRQNG